MDILINIKVIDISAVASIGLGQDLRQYEIVGILSRL